MLNVQPTASLIYQLINKTITTTTTKEKKRKEKKTKEKNKEKKNIKNTNKSIMGVDDLCI